MAKHLEGRPMNKILKVTAFWLFVLTAHGCSLNSDLEMAEKEAAFHAALQAELARGEQ